MGQCRQCAECKCITEYPNGAAISIPWECSNCGYNLWNKVIELDNGASNLKFLPHPLLNPDSKHYSMVDDVEAIVRMEQMYDVPELMSWAKITAMKYRLRIGNKDDVLKEAKKLLGYEAYYTYLKGKRDA